MDEFLKRCGGGGGGGGGGKPKAQADWGACVLLFTAKHDTSPLALSLANSYRCNSGLWPGSRSPQQRLCLSEHNLAQQCWWQWGGRRRAVRWELDL